MALLGCSSATSVAYLARLDRQMVSDGLAGGVLERDKMDCNPVPLYHMKSYDICIYIFLFIYLFIYIIYFYIHIPGGKLALVLDVLDLFNSFGGMQGMEFK